MDDLERLCAEAMGYMVGNLYGSLAVKEGDTYRKWEPQPQPRHRGMRG